MQYAERRRLRPGLWRWAAMPRAPHVEYILSIQVRTCDVQAALREAGILVLGGNDSAL